MYIKKTWKAGRTVEVKKTYSARFGKKIARSGNILPTSKAQEKVNQQMAVDELRRILNENFRPGDWHADFTYPQEEPPSKQRAKETLLLFMRRLRQLYRSMGVELKYVSVTEYEKKRIHHHVVLPNTPDYMNSVKALWRKTVQEQFYTKEEIEQGEPQHMVFRWSQLDTSGQYGELADYLIKETSRSRKKKDAFSKRRYCCSKNIVHPRPTVEIISANEWKKEPPQRKGHYIDKNASFNGVSENNGMPMQVTVYVKVMHRRC